MAVRFSAIGDRYTATTGLPAAQIYTVTCWAMVAVNRADFSIPASLNNATDFVFIGAGSDGLTQEVGDNVGSTATGSAFSLGVWAPVAMVVNGTTVDTYTASGPALPLVRSTSSRLPPNVPTALYVGSDQYDEWFNGRVAAYKVWQAALTAAEVALELAQTAPVRRANLLRFHPFKVAELTDYSGNGNTLTAGSTTPTTEADPPIPWVAAGLSSSLVHPGRGPAMQLSRRLWVPGSTTITAAPATADVSATTIVGSTVTGARTDTAAVSATTSASSTVTAAASAGVTGTTTVGSTVTASTTISGYTFITVTGTYENPDGTFPAGKVTFTPTGAMRSSSAILEPGTVTGRLNGSGVVSVSLAATDDSGVTPTDVTYLVVETITGAPTRSYNIAVPHSGGSIDLATVSYA